MNRAEEIDAARRWLHPVIEVVVAETGLQLFEKIDKILNWRGVSIPGEVSEELAKLRRKLAASVSEPETLERSTDDYVTGRDCALCGVTLKTRVTYPDLCERCGP